MSTPWGKKKKKKLDLKKNILKWAFILLYKYKVK